MFSFFGRGKGDTGSKGVPPPARRPALNGHDVARQALKPKAPRPAAAAPPTTPATSAQTAAAGEAGQLRKLIERFDEVPASQGMLTVGARAVLRIPREFEFSLAAIELGPKRAAILFDPAMLAKSQMRSVVGSLRAKLMSDGYSFEAGGDFPCKGDVIKLLIDDYVAKHGGSEIADANRVRSQAKERFLAWLDSAVKEGATDIHVQVVGSNRAIVQLRVDGELENLRDERRGIYASSEAIEAMAWPFNSGSTKGSNNSAQWEPSLNLYCMTEPRVVNGKQIALRYQSLRGHVGPKMIARLLNVDVNAPTLTYGELGYAESQRAMMLDVANMPSGFVMLAGVTGSGKTTSMKTFVETHPGNGSMAMYSMEDPVEYPLRGVHQIVLQRDVADKTASVRMYNETVTSLMRADPDIVIVGEIRDSATAGAGQQIVETGHMALGTVHAHLIPGIVPRLTNEEIGMSRDVLTNPNMLTLLAYQALIPKLCSHCKQAPTEALAAAEERDAASKGVMNAAGHIQDVVQALEQRFNLPPNAFRFRNQGGCSHCNQRGTKGVTVVAEMLIPDRQWLEFTREGKDYEAMVHYRQQADRRFDTPDMTGKTIFHHTLYKALSGGVDPRQCERFDSFKRFELEPSIRGSDRK
jgi:general secretion pathway protein E